MVVPRGLVMVVPVLGFLDSCCTQGSEGTVFISLELR